MVTGLAQVFFKDKANGQLIVQNGKVVGSRIIGQAFVGPGLFSLAAVRGGEWIRRGEFQRLATRADQSAFDRPGEDRCRCQSADNPEQPVPVDLVTSSGSGLDPHISPAAAEFQVARVARERGIGVDGLRQLVLKHTEGRQLGFLGEARVNVLELNLELDERFPLEK